MKRTLALILAALMIFAVMAGCGKKEEKTDGGTTAGTSAPKTEEPKTTTGGPSLEEIATAEVHPSDKELHIALTSEPNSWQQLTMSIASANIALQTDILYDTLVNYDSSNNEFVPNLATSWEWIDDTTMRFHLREDVTSLNGDPFTADDVVYTFQTGCAETALSSYYTAIFDVNRIKAVDKYTVDIATNEKYPFLILDLTHCAYEISVKASVDAAGGLEATKTNPICATGAYKLVDHASGQYAKFERREDYWGTMPYYKTVTIFFVSDPETRAMGLEAGDYDVVQKPSSSLCTNLEKDPNYTVQYLRNETVVIFPINTSREPMNIKEIRQAIALAINYDAILSITCDGHGEICDCPFSSNSQAYTPVDASKPCFLGKYDPEAAKAKLVEAGYPDGFDFSITYRTNDSAWVKSAEIVQNNLQDIGIKVTLNQVESGAFYPISESGDFDSLIWTNANPSPRRMIQILDDRYTQCNVEAGWINQDYMDLFDAAITELDDDARLGLFKEINDILREDVPLIPLVKQYNPTLTTSKIVNYATDPYGSMRIETMYEADYLA